MNNLKRLIGPAPSEMEFPDLLKKIRKRREIIGSDLFSFRESLLGKPKGKKVSKKKPKKTMDGMAFELGVDMETFQKMQEELMEAVVKENKNAS